jgi:uncharacterized YigZ family protein
VNIVEQPHQSELIIKKSRFIGYISPCHSEAEVARQLHSIQHRHPHASHIVYAYRIFNQDDGLAARFYDAGEPSGTAGKPIYQHLEGKQLINLLVAAVRYFGGIKLGAGGLTRAYSAIAKQVIDEASIKPYIAMAEQALTLEYARMNALEYQLKKLDGEITRQDFAEQIQVVVRLPLQNLPLLLDLFG